MKRKPVRTPKVRIPEDLIDKDNGVILHVGRIDRGYAGRSWSLCDPLGVIHFTGKVGTSLSSLITTAARRHDFKVKSMHWYDEVMSPGEWAMTVGGIRLEAEGKSSVQ